MGLAIKLPTLDVDTILANSHAEVLHGENSASLTTTLATTSISWALNAESTTALSGILLAASWSSAWESGRSSQVAHWVVGLGVRGADAGVLVSVRGDIRDELLGCEREEVGEFWVGGWWWGDAGAG